MIETATGPTPRTNFDVSIDEQPGRCLCGAPAVGIDARDESPTCADCARLEADGGQDVAEVRRMLRRAEELRREAQQLEIAAIGFDRREY